MSDVVVVLIDALEAFRNLDLVSLNRSNIKVFD